MATINTSTMIKDVTLEVDEFSKNRIISGANAEAQQLYILLYSKPGDFEDDPEKGIDIAQYRYGLSEEDSSIIQQDIELQVSKYCSFQLTNVKLSYTNRTLAIQLSTSASDDIIVFKTAEDSSTQMQLIKS